MLCLHSLGMRLHAFCGDSEMVLDLDSLRIIQQEVSEPVKQMVMAWAKDHRRELMAGRFAAPAAASSVTSGGLDVVAA